MTKRDVVVYSLLCLLKDYKEPFIISKKNDNQITIYHQEIMHVVAHSRAIHTTKKSTKKKKQQQAAQAS
jgi:hypothetical protein